jgi:transcription initiation factor TFIIIB Brf1 subunit/transcription initiation factor TFIIB
MKHLEKTTFDQVTGETICLCCGRVVNTEREIIQTPKTSSLQDYLKQTQHGVPLTNHHDRGLNTILGPDVDHAGNKISDKSGIYRLRQWQARVAANSATEKRLYHALQRHHEITAYLVVPKPLADSSVEILRKIISKGLLRGVQSNYVSATAIYWAYRQRSIAFSIKSMTEKLQIRGRKLLKYCLDVDETLHLKTDNRADPILIAIHKIAGIMKLNNNILLAATKLLEIARRATPEIGDRNSFGMAAAILYESQETKTITQNDFSEAARISAVTIRLNRRLLGIALDKLAELDNFKTAVAEYRRRRT